MKKYNITIFDANRRTATTSGYGLMAKELPNRLKDMGHTVSYYPDGNTDLWLWIRPPHYIEYQEFNPRNKNVFFTMHESDKFEGWKSNWPDLLNKCTAVIVPTDWNKEVFTRAGVTVPIYVVPLGVDTKTYHGIKSQEFSVLSVHEALGKDSSREMWKESVNAYYEAFYNNKYRDVSYTIKTWNGDKSRFYAYQDEVIRIKKYKRELLPPINILDIELVAQDMNNLYAKHWAFVKNSIREGWSLPTLEAVATGTRVISRQLPTMPYLNKNNADFFGDESELKDKLWENFRRWRKWKVGVNKWTWKESAKKLEEVFKWI